MRVQNVLTAVLTGLLLFSCSKEDSLNYTDEESSLKTFASRSQESSFTSFIYHGKTYESFYTVNNDSVVTYDNKEVQLLAEKFDETPGLVSFYYPDGTIEYFDTHDEFMSELNRLKDYINNFYKGNENICTYGFPALTPADRTNNDAELYLYDDVNFEDTKGSIILKRGTKQIAIPHLKKNFSPNMNDKTSSLQAFSIAGTTLFELFEDDNYRSHCMSFILNNSQRVDFGNQEFSVLADLEFPVGDDPRQHWGIVFDANLKDNHVIGTTNSKWNDRITSVRITRQ